VTILTWTLYIARERRDCYDRIVQSPITVGILMIAMAGLGLVPLGPNRASAGAAQYAIAGVLVVGGALLLMRQRWAFYVALGAAGVLIASGIAALAGMPQMALPLHPMISVVIGLYLVLRVVMAKKGLKKPEPKAE
jgi:glucose dehydrogenase